MILLRVAGVLVLAGALVPTIEAQTWSDEFNGTGAVDSTKWVYDVGAGGWGNNELQYYQSGAANAVQGGGFLRITARQQSVGGAAYTSARLKTQGRMNFGPYGRIEARLRGPMGQGLWPAFWSLGSNFPGVAWPGSGEIDIMEHINTGGTTFGTIHWDMSGYQFYTAAQPAVNFAAWNTYAIEWNSSYIRWVVNGANVGEANILNNINGTEEFHRPFFLILNLAVGGNWPGPPNGSAVFPAFLDVDYVRYWAPGAPNATPTPTPGPGPTATPGPTPTPGPAGPISPTAWYSIVNRGSSKCIDARASASTNGTAIQQYTCNNTRAQQFQFQPTSGGFVRLNNRNNAAQVIDVNGVSTADNALIHLWTYRGANNQQWQPVSEGGGFYRLVSRHSGKCLDVPAASTADSVQLVQFACNGSAAQSFRLVQQP